VPQARRLGGCLEAKGEAVSKTYTEWRICGSSATRGQWKGAWTTEDPLGTANRRYDLKQYVERNDEVWIDSREVTVSDVTRVAAADALEERR
jgi:hypothetical protein